MKFSDEDSTFGLATDAGRLDEHGFIGPFTAFRPDAMQAPFETITEQILASPSEFSPYPSQSRHLDSRTVWKLCSGTAIVDKLLELLGPDLMIWSSFIFDKGGVRPELDGEIPWHQDIWFWGYESITNLSVWLALTPVTSANGCVELIPGSHRHMVPHVRTGQADKASWFGGFEAQPAEAAGIEMILKPGQFFIFTEQTLHRSKPNFSGQRRVGLSVRVARPSQKPNRAEPCVMLHGADKFGINQLIDPPTGEPELAPPLERLQASDQARIEGPWPGLGWHAAEQAAGRWIRWTGPERVSWVDLRWRGSDAGMLKCIVTHAAAPHLLERLHIRVNCQPVELSCHAASGGTELTGPINANTLRSGNGRARVELELPSVVTPDQSDPNRPEARTLGIALCHISITDAH